VAGSQTVVSPGLNMTVHLQPLTSGIVVVVAAPGPELHEPVK